MWAQPALATVPHAAHASAKEAKPKFALRALVQPLAGHPLPPDILCHPVAVPKSSTGTGQAAVCLQIERYWLTPVRPAIIVLKYVFCQPSCCEPTTHPGGMFPHDQASVVVSAKPRAAAAFPHSSALLMFCPAAQPGPFAIEMYPAAAAVVVAAG